MAIVSKEHIHNEKNFASRYIVDVSISTTYIQLGDSSRAKFYIDPSDSKCLEEFKTWFSSVFTKGKSGVLTVFEYKKVENDGAIISVITHIIPTFADTIVSDLKC